MVTLYITSGPSGSGKSTYYINHKEELNNPILVCPDDIRKEINGDVSDQRNGEQVWKRAYEEMKDALKNKKEVYFSATFCTPSSIISLINEVGRRVKIDEKIKIVILKFTDGYDLSLLINRVEKDLREEKERSNTLIKNENGQTIIENQREKWMKIDWEKIKEIQKWFKNLEIEIKEV